MQGDYGMKFVSGGVTEIREDAEVVTKPETAQTNVNNVSNEDFARMVHKESKQATKKMRAARLDSDFGHFEKHTKGFGLKMLSKYGFKGRLGKEEQGISNPITAVKRAGQTMGLGYGGSEMDKSNEDAKRDYFGSESEEDDDKGWQIFDTAGTRRTKKKRKKVYKVSGVDGLDDNSEAPPKQKQVIVDMRGSQPRIITDAGEINKAESLEDKESKKKKIGKELIYNINLISDMNDLKLHKMSRTKQTMNSQEFERERMIEMTPVMEQRVEHLKDLVASVRHLQQEKEKNNGYIPLDKLKKVFKIWQQDYREEHSLHRLFAIAGTEVKNSLDLMFCEWQPFESNSAAFTSELREWDSIFRNDADPDSPHEIPESILMFEDILEECVLTRLRAEVFEKRRFDPTKPDAMLDLVSDLRLILPERMIDEIIDDMVLPKVNQAMVTWNPTDRIPIHLWLHCWLPLLQKKLQSNFWQLSNRMMQALQNWHPSDLSAVSVVTPWQGVFSTSEYMSIIERSVMPKLARALSQIDISSPQTANEIDWIVPWIDYVPKLHITCLLEGEFFRQFKKRLANMLAGSASPAETAKWFKSWRDRFPAVLLTMPQVNDQFKECLKIMSRSMQDTSAVDALLGPDSLGYNRLMARHRNDVEKVKSAHSEEQERLAKAKRRAAGGPDAVVTFKEVVEEFAAQNSVSFFPSGRRVVGKEVFKFGKRNIYLDNDVCYVESGKDNFVPIALEELLASS
eukprot:TRINITY_DN4624_c0_g1_i1.p1 TRINITY_DN4624_c0_g1~~TRINITY_DN4624_c0_g1_i1.p1  ORF type:complete len:738 (+),score=225.80 TRINITY_DN4624_c0_g1_i1:174-2387(+)